MTAQQPGTLLDFDPKESRASCPTTHSAEVRGLTHRDRARERWLEVLCEQDGVTALRTSGGTSYGGEHVVYIALGRSRSWFEAPAGVVPLCRVFAAQDETLADLQEAHSACAPTP
ncbi:MAG: hypothetical protein KUG77_22965 [Nannocystaceae bacterium]|nr:hypothetical protein [Nannocystaceae bacterium]